MYFRDVLGEDFSPSSGSSLIWSIIIKYNDTLDEIRVIACYVKNNRMLFFRFKTSTKVYLRRYQGCMTELFAKLGPINASDKTERFHSQNFLLYFWNKANNLPMLFSCFIHTSRTFLFQITNNAKTWKYDFGWFKGI